MKKIIVNSPKHGRKEILIDDKDYKKIKMYAWFVTDGGGRFKTLYARANVRLESGKRIGISMHRLILGLTDPTIITDHKDRNGLNNQKTNLRECDKSKNRMNVGTMNGRRYVGVYYINKKTSGENDKYRAIITVNKKRIGLGCFNSEVEAAKARDEAAKKYHGEFANLNFK